MKTEIKIGNWQLKGKIQLFFFLLIIIGGILLRLYQFNYNFDKDEVVSITAASGTFFDMITFSMEDRPHPPLHYVILWLWVHIFGSSEVSARLLSILSSFLFLLILYKLALLLMPKWSSLFVLSICSFSPFFIYYGQQARPYSLISLFSIASVYLFFKNQNKSSTKNAVLYFFSCAALVYTHYMGVLLLLPQLAAIVFFKIREQRKLLFYGLSGILSIVLWILLLYLFDSPLTEAVGNISWIGKPRLLDFVPLYIVPFGFLPELSLTPVIPKAPLILVALIAVIISFIIIKYKDVNRRNVIMLSAFALFGPIITLAVSRYGPVSLWAPRQMIGPLICFIVLIGIGLTLFRGGLIILFGLILIAWCILNVPNAFPVNSKPPYRFIANLILEKYPDQDIIVQERFLGLPLEYYLNKKVNYFNNENLDTSKQSIFVCRSAQCDKLNRIKLHYSLLETRTINWWGENWWAEKKEHASSIEIHFLRKMQ